MKRILICNLNEKLEEEVLIKGWVHRIRKLKSVTFIILRDRSGMIQCVLDNKNFGEDEIKLESVIEVKGIVVNSNSKINNMEVSAHSVDIICKVMEELPIQINKNPLDANLETLLDNRVLSLRNTNINSIFRIQALIAQGFRDFLIKEGFTEIFTPKIVKDGAEGGTNMFMLKYFNEKAYLAQSPQFYKQMMVGAGYERVFEIAHVYRAEEHDTRRHLNEYVSMDLEMGFIEDEKDIMRLENDILIYIMDKLKQENHSFLKELDINIPEVPENIPSITFPEAIEILKEKFNKVNEEGDLDPESEKLLYEYSKEYLESEFLFVTDYPRSKRPMYTLPKGELFTHSFDLIFRGLEITTGGQRIHSYKELIENIKYKGLNPSNFSSYTEIFKYGVPPHGGLAIGLERLTAQIIGLNNVREATLFPRDKTRITP